MISHLKTIIPLAMAILCFSQNTHSQYVNGVDDNISAIHEGIIKGINTKAGVINRRIIQNTKSYLNHFAKEERKLRNKLARKDAVSAERIFGDAQKQYDFLLKEINDLSSSMEGNNKLYLPGLDTLQTMMIFLKQTGVVSKMNPGTQPALDQAMARINVLQGKFYQLENMHNYIKNRRRYLKEQLGRFGMVKNLQKYHKQVYYFGSQVGEYKKIFDDPSKMERKAIELFKRTSLFNDFFKKHSQLAGMFSLPESLPVGSEISLTGLQTREAVQQVLLQRFGTAGDIQQIVRQQVQGDQSPFMLLKENISQLGEGSSDQDMPDFKPNTQKTRRFKDRIEVGTNLQTLRGNRFFPVSSDIGMSLGYKLNDKSLVGIGASYRMGWGKDIRNIAITHEGAGLRTFLDYKINGSFYVAGGAELNYRDRFSSIEVLKSYSSWQKSGLVGLSKKYNVSRKLKGDIKLLWDFLSYQQIPRTQPIVFRVGYTLKK